MKQFSADFTWESVVNPSVLNRIRRITKAFQDYLSEVILSKWISESQPVVKGS